MEAQVQQSHLSLLGAGLLLVLANACGSTQGKQTEPVPAVQVSTPREPLPSAPRAALDESFEFFPGATHDASLPRPDDVLGEPLGHRLASHAEVLSLWRQWAELSPRVTLQRYGSTHEGRELVIGTVTSEANQARMDSIRDSLRSLANPRGLSREDSAELLETTPAVAWMGYSIHGDETSGVDGGLAFAHHLIAGQDADVVELLERVVVVFDPCMNPDGRERIRGMFQQTRGAVPNLDTDSLHRGRWPWGRGNHYLFDMNRDWMAGIAPETRGRWAVLQDLPPQLFVDAHEMGALDTYLFYPQAEPRNPYLPERLLHWQSVVGGEQASAFDGYGWSYYTREWADAWAPFYSDAWGSLGGAIGMLYEQARFGGQSIRRITGEVATYREAVWHQAVASKASVRALAEHRSAILSDWAAFRRAGLEDEDRPAFAFVPGSHPRREAWLFECLRRQGIEWMRSTETLHVGSGVHVRGAHEDALELPVGSVVISARQAAGARVEAYLAPDPRLSEATLNDERASLERDGSSKMYDVTSWDLPHALDLDGWWIPGGLPEGAGLEPLDTWPSSTGGVAAAEDPAAAVYGWIVDGRDDAAIVYAAQALELGLAVQFADEPFESAGHSFARGSLLVRRHENGEGVELEVARAAARAGVTAIATTSARAPAEGHDLGGGHFRPLHRPRVALVAGSPTSPTDFGHLWHELDQVLGLPVTLLEASELSSYDLRRYDTIVIPPAGGVAGELSPVAEDLRAWVRSGGTLIATGSSAGALASETLGLSQVRRMRDVLEDVEAYRFDARRELAAKSVHVDPALVWDAPAEDAPAQDRQTDSEGTSPDGNDASDPTREDAWKRRFMPTGVTLLGLVDEGSWLTAGCDGELPVFFDGSTALMTRAPVRTPVRLAAEPRLRLGGLLWPEARERLAGSAWLTQERLGHGQVILFAAAPVFRGHQRATARLFCNAVVLGSGLGAQPPRAW